MLETSNGNGNDDRSFYALLYQQAAQVSVIALEMVIPVVIGVGLDRLFGTVVLFAILGAVFGMALGFWQLIRIAQSRIEIGGSSSGADKSPDTGDNGAV